MRRDYRDAYRELLKRAVVAQLKACGENAAYEYPGYVSWRPKASRYTWCLGLSDDPKQPDTAWFGNTDEPHPQRCLSVDPGTDDLQFVVNALARAIREAEGR